MLAALESVDWVVWAYLAIAVALVLSLVVIRVLDRRTPAPVRVAPPDGYQWVSCERCGHEFAQALNTGGVPPRICWRCLA